MKKFIISVLVGTIVLFIWSFLSWVVLPVHTHSFHYAPKQDSVLKALNGGLPGEGAYMMPMADNRNAGSFDSKYRQAAEENMKSMMGKPYAMVFYGTSKNDMDPMQYVIGILFDLFTVTFAVTLFVMAKDKLKTFFMRWWFFIVLGAIIACSTYVVEWNWMGFPWHYIKGMVLDTFMQWGLCGAWLAWYLGRA